MAVIIQKMVGSRHGSRFYPDFAGVVRSHNFYPSGPANAEDGVAAMALGLGRTVVDGGRALSFSPKHPRHLLQFSTTKDMLENSQRDFVAVEMEGDGEVTEKHHPLSVAEADGTLTWVASTYSPENDAVYDGISRPGVRLVSFAPLLKSKALPLPAVFERLMELGRRGMNTEVEIEFAVDLRPAPGEPTEFAFLQMRPMALSRELEEFDTENVDPAQVLVRSSSVLGNGKMDHLRDVVVVDHDRFDRAKTTEIAAQVARLNAELVAEGVPYILFGLGRWGSADPWLGIPVTWEQIAGARVIVEAGLKDIKVTPSQGSHFFQNLTSFRVGFFTINEGDGFIDWDWLAAAPAVKDAGYVRRLHFEHPLLVAIDGKRQKGVILKPDGTKPSRPKRGRQASDASRRRSKVREDWLCRSPCQQTARWRSKSDRMRSERRSQPDGYPPRRHELLGLVDRVFPIMEDRSGEHRVGLALLDDLHQSGRASPRLRWR